MRIDEVLLTESFKDLERSLENSFLERYGKLNPSLSEVGKSLDQFEKRQVVNLLERLDKLRSVDPEVPNKQELFTPAGFTSLIRHIVKAMKQKIDPDKKDTAFWIRIAKDEDWLEWSANVLDTLVHDYHKWLTDPTREDPNIETVAKSDKFQIYRLNNYAAARHVCNKLNLNWCTGSSDPGWFDDYGKQQGREHYVLRLSDGTAISIQSGSSGFLITSQDNQHDVNHQGRGRGDSEFKIAGDIHRSGLGMQDVLSIVKTVIDKEWQAEAFKLLAREPAEIAEIEKVDDATARVILNTSTGNQVSIELRMNAFDWYTSLVKKIEDKYRLKDDRFDVNQQIQDEMDNFDWLLVDEPDQHT